MECAPILADKGIPSGSPVNDPEVLMKKLFATVMLLAAVVLGAPSFAAEPSLHEVYQTANAGKLDEARQMMREVLAAHPNSGKAHYVEAELLARQGQVKQAATELATAEKLSPGLSFASAESVSSLRHAIDRGAAKTTSSSFSSLAPMTNGNGFPWGMMLTGLGLVAFIIWAARFMTARNNQSSAGAVRAGAGSYAPSATSPVAYGAAGQGYGAPGAAPAPAAGPGFGSQMLGGLATGVAVGAGVAAGEALMHRVLDGRKSSSGFSDLSYADGGRGSSPSGISSDDLGGNDFGISDSASWDDAGSGGDDDWN